MRSPETPAPASAHSLRGVRRALLAGVGADGVAVLVARAPGSDLDCGKLLSAVAKAASGRGGGGPDRAEGRVPPGVNWPALVAAALSR